MFGFFDQILAIDIGSSAVKLVQVTGQPGKYKLAATGIEVLPRGAVVQGEIANSGDVLKTLRRLVANSGISLKNKKLAISVSGNAVIVKRVNVRIDANEDIGEQLFEEAKQQLHDDLEEMYFRYFTFDSPFVRKGETAAIIVASKISVIEEYVQLAHELGLKVGVTDCDIFCLANSFNLNYPGNDQLQILINVGASSTQILIVYNAELLFSREFYVAGDYITQKVVDATGVDFDNAEALKISACSGETNIPEGVIPAIREAISAIVQEVSTTVSFFKQSDEFPDEIKHDATIYISGGGANTIELAETISEQMECEVKIINPFTSFEFGKGIGNVDALVADGPIYSVASGLAIRRVKE